VPPAWDPTQPHDVVPLELPPPLPPAAPTPVSADEVVTWLRTRFDWQYIEDRVTDFGWGYSINTQTDAFLETGDPLQGVVGNGPIIVVKRTRGVWFFGSAPGLWNDLDSATEADFYAALRAESRRRPSHRPDQWLHWAGRRTRTRLDQHRVASCSPRCAALPSRSTCRRVIGQVQTGSTTEPAAVDRGVHRLSSPGSLPVATRSPARHPVGDRVQ
jgi:hypothetical protein